MTRTTKLVSLALLAIGVLIFAGAYSQVHAQGILDSYHNLNPDYTPSGVSPARKLTGDYKEICVYCHTPHGGDPTSGPLWNRDTSVATYTMYSSPTFDATLDTSPPTGVSKACLSCHDGSVSINALRNKPGTGTGPAGTDTKFPVLASGRANDQSLIGTDLSNDHPISMEYASAKSPGLGTATIGDNTHDSGFRSVATGYVDGTDASKAPSTGVKLPLYSGMVQCASCHDPHETRTKIAQDGTGAGQVFFLRVSNANSALCRTCHLK